MKRSFYSNNVKDFLSEPSESILGKLNSAYNLENLKLKQNNAWESQIQILKNGLKEFERGRIYFEFSIPRMGKRADNILLIDDLIFIIEFKVGSKKYDQQAMNQVLDYCIDLQNFHEGSHDSQIVPILISTKGEKISNNPKPKENIFSVLRCNERNFGANIMNLLSRENHKTIDIDLWETSTYKPTPTIIEAAQALYRNHNVEEITRNEAGSNLITTSNRLNQIINETKKSNSKSICFVTGTPGAGKTLVGLNIVNERKKLDENENAVFLSGNGPLVTVLREALARDRQLTDSIRNVKTKIDDARREFNSKIQNIHHFRDEFFSSKKAPNERVVVFDESQRAWNLEKTVKFVSEKYKNHDFSKSEPDFLIDFMDRHEGWCCIICLIGGGQEINTGEAGIEEWLVALRNNYPHWKPYFSNSIVDTYNYLYKKDSIEWAKQNGEKIEELHLAVSMRSFRSKKLSEFVEALLKLNEIKAKKLFIEINETYPIRLTRDLIVAKKWIKKQRRGTEKSGLLVSSSGRRLRAQGIDSENGVRSNSDKSKIISWFLATTDDIRSSSFLEVPATQFAIQGLELDWICLAWGGDLSHNGESWDYRYFRGSNWNNHKQELNKKFLLNAYRVLLTRARQGMVLYVPFGEMDDKTRPPIYYDGTYNYLKKLGIKEI